MEEWEISEIIKKGSCTADELNNLIKEGRFKIKKFSMNESGFSYEFEQIPKERKVTGTHGTEYLKGAVITDFEILPGTGLQRHSPAFFNAITIRRTNGSFIRICPNGDNLCLTTCGLKPEEETPRTDPQ
jgi:hypothetical protein